MSSMKPTEWGMLILLSIFWGGSFFFVEIALRAYWFFGRLYNDETRAERWFQLARVRPSGCNWGCGFLRLCRNIWQKV